MKERTNVREQKWRWIGELVDKLQPSKGREKRVLGRIKCIPEGLDERRSPSHTTD